MEMQTVQRTRWVLTALLSVMSLTLFSVAQAREGYVDDDSGQIIRSGAGDCVRTMSWDKNDATEQCFPGLTKTVTIPAKTKTERVTKKISLQTDALFPFDSAKLTDEGKSKLDDLAQKLPRAENAQIEISAYTDRIGTEQYNQRLSQRRAQAVKEYLAQRGIPVHTIAAQGKGITRRYAQCEGKTGRELIQCLAPNRRADVEFAAFEVSERTRQEEPAQHKEEINQDVLQRAIQGNAWTHVD
jgi:OOP family OmpA-OmpF porin